MSLPCNQDDSPTPMHHHHHNSATMNIFTMQGTDLTLAFSSSGSHLGPKRGSLRSPCSSRHSSCCNVPMISQAPEVTFEVGTITQMIVTTAPPLLPDITSSSESTPLEGRSADSYDQLMMESKNEELKSEDRIQVASLIGEDEEPGIGVEEPQTKGRGSKQSRKSRIPRQPKQPKQPQQQRGSRREITKCAHVDRVFYAKGMCKNCYHAYGREKPTNACPHYDRPKYAHGVCKNCYLSKYHRERRAQRKLLAAQQNAGDDITPTAFITLTSTPAILLTSASGTTAIPQADLADPFLMATDQPTQRRSFTLAASARDDFIVPI